MTLFVVEIKDKKAKDKKLTGGKGASLAELAQITNVPPAFVVTASSYRRFISQDPNLLKLIEKLDSLPKNKLSNQGTLIRKTIGKLKLPENIIDDVSSLFTKLTKKFGKDTSFAVRSSGTTEDGTSSSFAGQYQSFMNQKNINQITASIKNCFASQFTDRAISYRNHIGMLHKKAQLAVVVQIMVKSEFSGIAFSVDPENGSELTSIDISYGIGEAIVEGKVTPDSYLVDPKSGSIVHRTMGNKSLKTVYLSGGGTGEIKTSDNERLNFAVSDKTISLINSNVVKIAKHYGHSVDTEFAIDKDKRLWFTQSRPETVNSQRNVFEIPMKRLSIKPKALLKASIILMSGKTGSPGVGQGRIIVTNSVEEARKLIKTNDILVTERTDPDWEEVMGHVSGIVTDIGGPNCHAAIISREHGIPCIVGSGNGTSVLKKYQTKLATLDAGSVSVYEGFLELEKTGENIDVTKMQKYPSPIPIGLVISNPETARRMHALSKLSSKFLISLLRVEFLLNEIGVHPQALLDFDRHLLKDKGVEKKIKEKIVGYSSGRNYYVSKLSEGISQFAAIFPESLITLRTTDFKTNEYKNLIGGSLYEDIEANPMMGWRGLIRLLSPENRETAKMEFEAIKKSRDAGYKNIQVMFPVVRDPEELTGGPGLAKIGYKGVFEIMKEVGLVRGRDDFKVGIMVEVPANVFRIHDFLDAGLDFISFGTNDLTQFTLAADRDGNEDIQSIPLYKETNKAVVSAVLSVIKACKERKVKSGICGQAPSNSPEFVKLILKAGIDSIGVMPDRYLPTYKLIKEVEKKR